MSEDSCTVLEVRDTSKGADKEDLSGATRQSSVLSLTNSVIGSGVLALPYALSRAGLIGGFLCLAFSTVFSGISFRMLVSAGDFFGVYTFKDVARQTMGKKFAPIAEIVVIGLTLGGVCSYGLIAGDSAYNVAEALGAPDWLLDRRLLVAILLCTVMVPLSMLSNLDVLRYASASAIASVMFTVVLVVVSLLTSDSETLKSRGSLVMFDGPGVFEALPIMGLAFTAHFNVLTLYKELKKRTKRRMWDVTKATTVICAAIYGTVAVSGYILFRGDIESNILNALDSAATGVARHFVLAAQGFFIFTILFSYPLVAFAVKRAVASLCLGGADAPERKQNVVALGVGLTVLLVAVSGVDLSLVLNITGTLFATLLVYVLPGLFYRRIAFEKGNHRGVVLAGVEIAVGGTIMAVGLWSIARDII